MPLRLIAAASSGLLLYLVSPPISWFWLHYLNWIPLLWALRAGDTKKNMLIGYFGGWVGMATAFYWITDTVTIFSDLPMVLAYVVLGLFATLFAIPYAFTFGCVHWFRERLGWTWVFLMPAVQVAMEKLWPSLFPHYHGSTGYRQAWLWQIASVLSVMSLTYLQFLLSAAFAELIYARREGKRGTLVPFGVFATVMVVGLAYGGWRHGKIAQQLQDAPTIRVAILQQDITMVERLRQRAQETFSSWVRLTNSVLPKAPQLVVWPEGAFPGNPNAKQHQATLGRLSKTGGFDFLIGGGTYERNPEGSERDYTAFNSCYHFDKQGVMGGRYDKMVPLPFGEYMPLSDTFPFLKGLVGGIGDFKAGEVPTTFEADEYTFSAPICYEAILESTMWDLSDVDLLINITNDGWFGDTHAPHQHAMLAAIQSIHHGRPMLRIAYTGISMVIEPHGEILYETKPYTEVAKVEELRLLTVPTGYRMGGWLFPWLCIGVALGAFVYARRRSPLSAAPMEE